MENKALFSAVLSIVFLKTCSSFPEDIKPHLVITSKASSGLPIFIGADSFSSQEKLLYIQEVKIFGDKVLIGCRNALYVLSTTSFLQETGYIPHRQFLTWKSSNKTRLDCLKKTSSEHKCQNYIRVVVHISSEEVLLCGTNAADPKCRIYMWSQTQLFKIDEHFSVDARFEIPYDDTSSLAYQFSDGYFFSSAMSAISGRKPAISRTDVIIEQNRTVYGGRKSSSTARLKSLKIDGYVDPAWLTKPGFVAMLDTPGRIYMFFRETAVDGIDPTEQIVYSRVARVCKSDQGGTMTLLHEKWTSFFKARLNCSVPGNPPFYFNEIQHVTEPVIRNGTKIIYATMTTPINSIAGSAVCAFSMDDIERVMEGKYKEKDSNTKCWKQEVSNQFNPPLFTCRNNTQDQETLKFIKKHSFMSEAVQSFHGKPIFMSTQSRTRFTAISVEVDVPGGNGVNVTVMYIGTGDGKLLKVTTNQVTSGRDLHTIFNEEWEVYQKKVCSRNDDDDDDDADDDTKAYRDNDDKSEDRRVRKVTLLPNSDVILVTFRHCIISLPKQTCRYYNCKSCCVWSGNPYCGWDGNTCVPLKSSNYQHIQQNLFGNESLFRTSPDEVKSACAYGIGYPLSLAIVSLFTLILLLYLLISKCFGSRCPVQSCLCFETRNCNKYNKGNKQTKNKPVKHLRANLPRVSIEATTSIKPVLAPSSSSNGNSNNLINKREVFCKNLFPES